MPAETLGTLKALGVDVMVWCNRCSHSATLSTAKLAAALGDDYEIPEIAARCRCSRCKKGGRDVISTRPERPPNYGLPLQQS